MNTSSTSAAVAAERRVMRDTWRAVSRRDAKSYLDLEDIVRDAMMDTLMDSEDPDLMDGDIFTEAAQWVASSIWGGDSLADCVVEWDRS